jgi:hypothetical protein
MISYSVHLLYEILHGRVVEYAFVVVPLEWQLKSHMLGGARAALSLVKKWNGGEPNLFNMIAVPFQLLTAE